MACALAAVLCVVSGIEAWRLEPLPVGRAEPSSLPEDPRPVRSVSAAELAVLLEADPFHPERRRPDVRYGEERVDEAVTAAAVERSPVTVQLLGTVVLPQERSLAMCRIGNERARLLRLGDTLSNMKLTEIGQGRAVFVGAQGQRLDLRVTKGGT